MSVLMMQILESSPTRVRRGEGEAHFMAAMTVEQDACLLWPYGVNKQGYGVMWLVELGRKVLVHRRSFWHTRGYWPEIGRHACDNPMCFNPKHIVDGTRTDNHRDMVERSPRYQNVLTARAKLTAADALVIRHLAHDNGLSSGEIAVRYGVSYTTTGNILRGDTWKDAGGPIRRLPAGRPRVAPVCGTERGYSSHIYHREDIDPACRAAHSRYAAERRAANKAAV